MILIKQIIDNKLIIKKKPFEITPGFEPYISIKHNNTFFFNDEQALINFNRAIRFLINMLSHKTENVLFTGSSPELKNLIKLMAFLLGGKSFTKPWVSGTITNKFFKKDLIKLPTQSWGKFFKVFGKLNNFKKNKFYGKLIKITYHNYYNYRYCQNINYLLSKFKMGIKKPAATFLFEPEQNLIAIKEINRYLLPIIGIMNPVTPVNKIDYPIFLNNTSPYLIYNLCSLLIDFFKNKSLLSNKMFYKLHTKFEYKQFIEFLKMIKYGDHYIDKNKIPLYSKKNNTKIYKSFSFKYNKN